MSAWRDFLAISRRLLDVLGGDGLGDAHDQAHFAVDGVEPAWVAQPETVEQAIAVLRVAAEHELAVVPAGLGARLGQGFPAERVDLVLSTARLSRIVEHAAADLTLTVEAGATLAALEEALRPAGQWLPLDPPRPAQTTIGGLVAAQATGPSRQRYGGPREWLLGVRALLADGTAVKSGGRVVKNVAGYDLQKLLVGSFGTLAVVVEATFKLAPRPRSRRTLLFAGGSTAMLAAGAAAVADSVFEPEIVELVLHGETAPRLVIRVAGTDDDVEAAACGIVERLASFGIEASSDAIDDAALRAELDSLQAPGADVVVLRAALRRDGLAAWLDGARSELAPLARVLSGHAHAGVGVVRLRLDGARREGLEAVVGRLREQAGATGGYLLVEQAPTAWKPALDPWGRARAGDDLMAGIKRAFDPGGRFSPGRFVGRL